MISGCSSECCQLGGVCLDPVFDNCNGGDWDYGVECDPYFLTCCLPDTPPTTTEVLTTSDGSTGTTTTNTPVEPGGILVVELYVYHLYFMVNVKVRIKKK